MTALEREVRALIIDVLSLDQAGLDGFGIEEPLFVDGLGLDSIDALEIAIAIEQRFGVRVKAGDEAKRRIFRDVRSLASYIASHRQESTK